MKNLGIHIEKPNSAHMIIYLFMLNVMWAFTILAVPLFNLSWNSPILIITFSCFIWHTLCCISGIEVTFSYPNNIFFHLLGNIVVFSIISQFI